MDILRRGSLAFASGCFGVILFHFVMRVGVETGILNLSPEMLERVTSRLFLYRTIVWGGLWGFAFMIPFFKGKWWLRGLIVGLAATLVAIFVFQKTVPPVQFIAGALFLNMVCWGLTAAFWHDKVVKAG